MSVPGNQLALQQAMEFLRVGKLREAEGLFRQALARDPRDDVALHGLGLIAGRAGNAQASADLIGQAIEVNPSVAQYHYNFAEPLRVMDRLDESAAALRKAIQLQPNFAPAFLNLGAVLTMQGKPDEAVDMFRAAIRLRPQDPSAYLNLGKVLRIVGRPEEAEESFRHAIALAPGLAPAYHMLGSCVRESGRAPEAVACFRKAIELKPDYREAHSNLCYALYFDPEARPVDVLRAHQDWARKFAEPLAREARPHDNDRSPARRLRIGYVSPNLRKHVVGLFMEPILERHDREQFEVFCYADVDRPDEVSERLRQHAFAWRVTSGATDEQLARLIRDDHIDVLIDLNLHMRGSRLLTFARRPAPVQIAHLAYCGTSGMRQMDWCVTDIHMSPPGTSDELFTEKLLRLPESYWSYRPFGGCPAVAPPPVLERGSVTFGSFNSFAKVNPRVMALWAKVLQATPGSRLRVHAPGGNDNRGAREAFSAHGVVPDRVELVPMKPLEEYHAQYAEIDIALDPFPYCGGTTSLDALWMGVPLVTLAGQTPLARTGLTLLANLGLEELVAPDEAAYVSIAAALAADRSRLAKLRSGMRERMRASVLLDEARYVHHLETAYRTAWHAWCRGA